MSGVIERAAQVTTAQDASELLERYLSPALVRAVACRAEELRFDEPDVAVDVASVTVEALQRLPRELRRPRLAAFTWSILGSACRAVARFDEAECALTTAARIARSSDTRSRVNVARRLATLRADQRREREARQLIASVLELGRSFGGREYAQELIPAAAVLIRFNDFQPAARYLEKAVTLLPTTGDRLHLGAIYNLARCRLELGSSRSELRVAAKLVRQATRLAQPGSFFQVRLRWLTGLLLHRLGHLDEGLEVLESAREGIDERGDDYDRALLLLDIAEVHLERDDAEKACEVARSSFAILSGFRNEVDAYKAVLMLHRAGTSLSLDRATVRTVRRRLLDLRR